MINKETIISAFNEKMTLFQWLKLVESALKLAVLESVTITQPSNDSVVFNFVFADGTTIPSPTINLPVGPQGPQGEQGPQGPQGPQGDAGSVKLYKHSLRNSTNVEYVYMISTDGTPITMANFNTKKNYFLRGEVFGGGVINLYAYNNNFYYLAGSQFLGTDFSKTLEAGHFAFATDVVTEL